MAISSNIFAQTITVSGGITVFTPTSVIVDANLTITGGGNINAATVNFGGGYISTEDRLVYPINLFGVTGTWTTATGVLRLSGTATTAQYQQILRSIRYNNTTGTIGQRTVNFTLGDAIPFRPCGATENHYYRFVTSTNITWTNARTAAASQNYFGLTGYLLTIMCQAENDLAFNSINQDGWIGASDAANEGDWRWVTGPEAGTQFWSGNGSGSPVGGNYNNWYSGEPNNDLGNEDYAHFWNTAGAGQWNDYPNTPSAMVGYYVEFNGNIPVTGSKIVDVCNTNITQQPVNQNNICAGANISYTTIANCADTYQWQVSTNGGATFTNITNGGVYNYATTESLNITGVTFGMNNYQYRCRVMNTTSNAAILTLETVPPIFNANPGNLTAQCDINEQPVYTNYTEFTTAGGSATDNCGINTASFTIISNVSDGNSCPEIVTRTYRIADICGNTTVYTQTITINDDILPIFDANPGNLTAQCDINEQPVYTNYTEFTTAGGSATDNCGINTASFTIISNVSDGNSCPEIVTRTYRIADICGNTTVYTQTITINDDILPTITVVENQNLNTDPSSCFYTVIGNEFNSIATDDNCGIASVVHDYDGGGNTLEGKQFPAGQSITVTWTITDNCGNVQTASFVITVTDAEYPEITAQDDLTTCNPQGEQSAIVTFDTPIATDNCSATLEQIAGLSSGSNFPLGLTINTFIATDEAGNETYMSFNVSVQTSSEAPAITTCEDSPFCLYTKDAITLNYGGGVVGNGASVKWYSDIECTNYLGSDNNLIINSPEETSN